MSKSKNKDISKEEKQNKITKKKLFFFMIRFYVEGGERNADVPRL